MEQQRDSAIVPIEADMDIVHGCHQILSAVNTVLVNFEFASERVDGEVKAALDDSRASLDKIVEITRAIQRIHDGRPPAAKAVG